MRGCVVLVALTAGCSAFTGTPTIFQSGSIIVPMDSRLQDRGILEAYGMVYEMLRRGIPVSWVIDGDKVPGGDDLPAVATYLTTAASTTASPHAFRGGPWVIDASHAAAAQTVVSEWRAAGHVSVAYIATESFTGEVSRRLFAAPSIVTFLGGHEYKTDLPYTTHPELNGVRVFLDSYFTARCTELADAPVVTVQGEPVATGNDVTVDLDWANDGTGRGRDGTLTLQLPANLTYVGDDSGGVYDPSTRTVTWDLDTLASGESGHITLTLVAAVDAVDTLDATLRYRVEATWFEVDWTGSVAHGPDSDGDGLDDGDEVTR